MVSKEEFDKLVSILDGRLSPDIKNKINLVKSLDGRKFDNNALVNKIYAGLANYLQTPTTDNRVFADETILMEIYNIVSKDGEEYFNPFKYPPRVFKDMLDKEESRLLIESYPVLKSYYTSISIFDSKNDEYKNFLLFLSCIHHIKQIKTIDEEYKEKTINKLIQLVIPTLVKPQMNNKPPPPPPSQPSPSFIDAFFPKDTPAPVILYLMEGFFPGLLTFNESNEIENKFIRLISNLLRNNSLKVPSQTHGRGKLSRVGKINSFSGQIYPLRKHNSEEPCINNEGVVSLVSDVNPVWFSHEPIPGYIGANYIGNDYGVMATRYLKDRADITNKTNYLIHFESANNYLSTVVLNEIEQVIFKIILRTYSTKYRNLNNRISVNRPSELSEVVVADIPLSGYECIPIYRMDSHVNDIFLTWNSQTGMRRSKYKEDRLYMDVFFKVIGAMESYLNKTIEMYNVKYKQSYNKINLLGLSFPKVAVSGHMSLLSDEIIISHKFLEEPLNKQIFTDRVEYKYTQNGTEVRDFPIELRKRIDSISNRESDEKYTRVMRQQKEARDINSSKIVHLSKMASLVRGGGVSHKFKSNKFKSHKFKSHNKNKIKYAGFAPEDEEDDIFSVDPENPESCLYKLFFSDIGKVGEIKKKHTITNKTKHRTTVRPTTRKYTKIPTRKHSNP